ncbi:TSUP family transporter [Psychrosphaera ytuae]|uniref:TSUP family transporter n=1 Tax=Psychrosphaera ytuae TaxID=2820710 RepID=UPI0038CD36A9
MDWLLSFFQFPELSTTIIVLLLASAFLAGFIDAIAGGGGLLTVPALLASGLPPHVALGTNKLAATFGSVTASYAFYKKKLFSPSFWRISLIATAIGAVFGTIMVSYLDAEVLNKLLPILIGFSALYALLNPVKPSSNTDLPVKCRGLTIKKISQGFTLGFYDGFAGPGTGAFWTVSNLILYKMNLLMSCGVARAMNFVSNICSLLAFIILGHVNFAIGLSMGALLMLGAYTGAHSAIRFGNNFIRPIFTLVVSVMAIKLAIDAWS